MYDITTHQAKYQANNLTRRLPANDINKLTASLQDAQVDLTPHQVEVALFAFKSPLSKGAILSDEVGLGKTIEAGIIPYHSACPCEYPCGATFAPKKNIAGSIAVLLITNAPKASSGTSHIGC